MTRNPRLTQVQKDFVTLLSAIQSGLSYEQIKELYFNKFLTEITDKQIKSLRRKFRDKIAELKVNEKLTLTLAESIGLLNLSNRINRLRQLERVVEMGIESYQAESISPRGETVSTQRYDLASAINALKLLREEMTSFEKDVPDNGNIEFSVVENNGSPESIDEVVEDEA